MAAEASMRETYGKTLAELGKSNPDIVVLDADLSSSTQTKFFAKEFPDRFFNCGIAEQNMMGIAAGLAASGKTAFASTFAVFATSRCFDQVRWSIAQPHRNVKIVATHSGITVGEDGASHQAIEDLSLMCALPGFTVIVPADAVETEQVIRYAASTLGPWYIRLPRLKSAVLYDKGYSFDLEKAVTMREGKDLTIIAMGLMVERAIKAAEALSGEGIDACVLNMHTLKPLDEDAVVKAAKETGAILTVEEHVRQGGLGSRVATVIAESYPVPMSFINIEDCFSSSGQPEELLAKHGLTSENIVKEAKALIKRKR
ncbi:MAG: transketolase family protein [Dehalococcoidia bacterium]|jgi:transketolase